MQNRHYPMRLTLLLVTFMLGGCANTPEVNFDYQPGFDFERLRSYAWLESDKPPSSDIRIDNDLVRDRVVAAVNNGLQGKGFLLSEAQNADFLVTWFGAIDKRIRIDTIDHFYDPFWGGGYYGFHRPWGPRFSSTRVSEYETGTLIIDFVTPGEKRLFWRGTGQSFLGMSMDRGLTAEETTAYVRQTVEAILDQFPPDSAIPSEVSD
jgi:hypothetical protein